MPLINGEFKPLDLPRKHAHVLLDNSRKWRYRCLFGGRNGAKDWSATGVIIEMAVRRKIRVLCTREVQKSIQDSIHQLLADTIYRLGYSQYFNVQKTEIHAYNGSSFIFRGLKDLNIDDIKSLEGVDIVMLGEAQDLTKNSWDVLTPTIRKPGSEIWIFYNPQGADDFVYKLTVVDPPENMIVMQVNYLDVPREWLSQETIDEANRMKAQSQEEYEYHWLGRPRNVGALVCPTFNKQIHVRTFPMEILKEANFFHGQDPHLHYYPANVWVARIPKGEGLFDYWVYNEWPMRSTFGGKFYYELRKEKKCTLSLKARSSIFRVMDNTTNKTHGWVRIRARGLDTRFAKGSGGESHTTNTRGIIQEMADVENGGLVFTTPAESNIDGARNQIRQLLEYDPLQEISQFNEPSLYVAPWCENMLNSLQFHCFNRENKETEDETRKDFWDALKIAMATAKTTSHEVFFDKDKKIDFPEEDNMTKLQDMFMHKQTRRQLVCA